MILEWFRSNKGGRFSDSEWSRILKAGGLVILNGVRVFKGRRV